MKSFLVLTTLILSLSGMAQEGTTCPEGQRTVITYNDCVPTAETMCATWYSKIECVPEEAKTSTCPEGTREETIYNDCISTTETMCAAWYSRTQCVEDVERPKLCSRDINPWGNPSVCRCDVGEYYNQVLGTCRAKNVQVCTADINQWGNPSQCSCDTGLTYDQTRGNCIPDENYPKP